MLILYYSKPYDQELGAGSAPDLRNLGQIGVRTARAKGLVPEMTCLDCLTSRLSASGGREPETGFYFQLSCLGSHSKRRTCSPIRVPHSKKSDVAINSGEIYDSTG